MDSNVGIQKSHLAPTPRIGGVAILLGAIAGYATAPSEAQTLLLPLLLAGLPAFGFGLLEDVTKKVSVRTRLLATMACGVLGWVLTGESITQVHVLGVDWLLSFAFFSVAFTAFAVGGVANSINIIDGFNGLAGGTAIVILTAFGAIATSLGDPPLAMTTLILAASVAGFIFVNWPFGKMFLGDGGAYFIGFAIAWVAVLLAARHQEVSPWALLLVCGYPVLEVLFSIVRRRRRDLSPGDPDRLHLHSLVKRRLVRRLLPNTSRLFRNSATGAAMWIMSALPAAAAVIWPRNIAVLAIALLFLGFSYSAIYFRLATFRWTRLPAQQRREPQQERQLSSDNRDKRHAASVSGDVKISVITATWNCAGTVGDALDSLDAQTYSNVEKIWIDGQSTDGTTEVLRSRLSDRRTTLISEPDKGIYDALNKGLRHATGDVVGFLHADDMLADDDVLAAVAAAFKDPTILAVYGDLEYVRKDKPSVVVRQWRAGQFSVKKLRRGWMPPHPTLYLRRDVLDRVGHFDSALRIAADYDHILRVFSSTAFRPAYLNRVLVRMRVGGASNKSVKNILRKSTEDLLVIRRNRVGGVWTLAWKNLSKVSQFKFARRTQGTVLSLQRLLQSAMQSAFPAKKEPE